MANLLATIKSWLSGIAQMRHPALIRLLGYMRVEAEEWEDIRRHNPGAKIERGVVVKGWRSGQLVVAPSATICRGTVLTLGDQTNGRGRVFIGAGTWIGQYNNFRAGTGEDIIIGENCLISQFCTLVSTDHSTRAGERIMDQPADQRRTGIKLGDDVWLGAGVTVLPGVTIGSGAVIAANSVVKGNIPANEIWAGSPAMCKGERSKDSR